MTLAKDSGEPESPFHFSPRPNRAKEIHWHEWDDDAFQQAQREDKPIFLDISAVWCHWCHVMDETTYSDPQVIDLLNRAFVPIRVDTDKRPEVNHRYNMGGWPSSVILTPEGEVLTGGTYLPPGDLESLLSQVAQIYHQNKAEIRARIGQLERNRATPTETVTEPLSGETMPQVIDTIKRSYDVVYGGFGAQPKFPQPDLLELILWQYRRTGEERLKRMVVKTLDAMNQGGLFDQVAGGFFRYSTNRDWSVPHYEKLLEDNAALTSVYVHAQQILGEPRFGTVARRVIDYVAGSLRDTQTGAFYGSQDADEEYYKLPPEQRLNRPAPYVDKTIYTNWNAGMATALLEAYRLLREESYLQMALRNIDFLWQHSREPGGAMYHYREGRPQIYGLFVDQVAMARCLVNAYEVTGENKHLRRAVELVDFARRTLADHPVHGFYDRPETLGALGRLKDREKPLGENSLIAEVLTAMRYLTGDEEYMDMAGRTLECFAPEYQQHGLFAAVYARAVSRYLDHPVRIVVVGDRQDQREQALRATALSIAEPNKVVEPLDPTEDRARLDQEGFPPLAEPRAYICRAQACLAAVSEPAQIGPAVETAVGGKM